MKKIGETKLVHGSSKYTGVVLENHICPTCRKEFKTEYKFAKYCSKECVVNKKEA